MYTYNLYIFIFIYFYRGLRTTLIRTTPNSDHLKYYDLQTVK